jgi:hypothetical protein
MSEAELRELLAKRLVPTEKPPEGRGRRRRRQVLVPRPADGALARGALLMYSLVVDLAPTRPRHAGCRSR